MSDEDLLTVEEVARRLRVSEGTVIRAIKDKRLRALKVEKQYRIPTAAVREWTTETGPGISEPQ